MKLTMHKSFLIKNFLRLMLTMPMQTTTHNLPGMLCSIEGIDGSGKTTVIKHLQQLFSETSIDPVFTKEPGGTELGQQLRHMILNQTVKFTPTAEFLLFAANRAQHFATIIIPNLEHSKLVISDRMADSSLAYQGYVKGVDLAFIAATNTTCMQNIAPDLVFYLRIDSQTALSRIKTSRNMPDKFEETVLPKIEQLLAGFETVFQNQDNVVVLDASMPAQDVAQKIFTIINDYYQKKINSHA